MLKSPSVPDGSLFTMHVPKRSASLTDPPKSDPCRPPLGPDQSSLPAERAALEQGGPAVRRPSRTQRRRRVDISTPSGLPALGRRETVARRADARVLDEG